MVQSNYQRDNFIFGKDKLVEPVDPDKRIDISKRKK